MSPTREPNLRLNGILMPKGNPNHWNTSKKQPKDKQRKLLNLFRLMGEHGKIIDKTKFRNEGDKIYAFKPQPDRYLCFFFHGGKIIVTNAFTKKTQDLPQGEKDLALKAFRSYEKRIKGETYYEEEI